MERNLSRPTIVVELRGGMIKSIHASFPSAVVLIADRDLLDPSPMEEKLNKMADDRLAQDDLVRIY